MSSFLLLPGETKPARRLGPESVTTDPVSEVKPASKHKRLRSDLLVSSVYVLVATLTRDRHDDHDWNCRPAAVQECKHDEILLSPLENHNYTRFRNMLTARMTLFYNNI